MNIFFIISPKWKTIQMFCNRIKDKLIMLYSTREYYRNHQKEGKLFITAWVILNSMLNERFQRETNTCSMISSQRTTDRTHIQITVEESWVCEDWPGRDMSELSIWDYVHFLDARVVHAGVCKYRNSSQWVSYVNFSSITRESDILLQN